MRTSGTLNLKYFMLNEVNSVKRLKISPQGWVKALWEKSWLHEPENLPLHLQRPHKDDDYWPVPVIQALGRG